MTTVLTRDGTREKRRGRPTPKGRQVQPAALAEVRELLGDVPRRRDLLIELLHKIQDRYGQISAPHIAALAEEMRLPQAEVYETATFYAHFDVRREDDAPLPPVTIRVCEGLSCALKGAERLMAAIEARIDPALARVVPAPCVGRCDTAPAVDVGRRDVDGGDLAAIAGALERRDLFPEIPDYTDLERYREDGGYRTLEAVRAGAPSRDDIVKTIDESGLRGLGGAGFPTGKKWSIVRGYPGPRYLVVNADEGEPGTFKDRYYLKPDPHRFLEGVLIAAHTVEAERAYIYLRDEYPVVREIMGREIPALEAAGLIPHGYIELRRGAGAYICGEESALIESVEGKRGYPRHRPPYVAQFGLFGRPTLINNVETLYWVRDILEKGAAWFARQGRHGSKGMRSYSVSGRVKEPGVKLAPAGITVRELIDEFCGGMAEGHRFRAYLPGGASGGFLPASMGDIPLDFGQLEKHGCFIGSHAVVILSDQDDLKRVVLNLMRFFEDESCGQCTPCRVGTEKAVKLIQRDRWDTGLLGELAKGMADASICGLGQAASNPLKCLIKYFPEELASVSSTP